MVLPRGTFGTRVVVRLRAVADQGCLILFGARGSSASTTTPLVEERRRGAELRASLGNLRVRFFKCGGPPGLCQRLYGNGLRHGVHRHRTAEALALIRLANQLNGVRISRTKIGQR